MNLLELRGIAKSFNGIYALKDIDLDFKEGEIHGLIGANGSGKSTLMNILNGENSIRESGGYEGDIYIEGERVVLNRKKDSVSNGIEMVHQELSLLDSLKVVENIKLNRENTYKSTDYLRCFSLVDTKKNREEAEDYLESLGVELDINLKLGDLQVSQKQFVEISRAIDNRSLKILMLDEPTSSLNSKETDKLLVHIRKLAESGVTIIFVSHRLEEVVEICDRVSILRDGDLVSQYEKKDFDLNKMALDMVGRNVIKTINTEDNLKDNNIMVFKDLSVLVREKEYEGLNLEIREDEVLGITGLSGHGYEMIAYGLMGLYDRKGQITYKDKDISKLTSKELIDRGIYLIPEDRKKMSLLMNKPIWENLVFESYDLNSKFLKYPRLGKLSLLDKSKIDCHCKDVVSKLNIKISDINQEIRELSGGNQQKVCIGRAMTMRPELLFIGEPTRGIDIYSKEIILNMLLDLNKKEKTTVVIYSGETEELIRVCNRIVVMHENRILGDFSREEYNTERFRLSISGREVEDFE